MNFHFNIAGRSKIWFAITAISLVLCFASIAVNGFNLGIDFTGGTIIDLRFEKAVSVEDVRGVLKEFSLENSTIQLAGDIQDSKSDSVVIRTYAIEDEQLRQNIMKALETQIGKFELLRMEKVGATVGSELTRQAALALAVSWVLMIAYVSYRFELNFAMAAILCLIQDVVMVLGFFSFFRLELDSSFVAALLTVVGYSINGTIVIFDRIRENLRSYRKSDGLVSLVNNAINQTMTRSIYTVSTVLFATISVYVFGGDTLKNFSLAMTVGFISGTLTSIFLAGSLWLFFRNRRMKTVAVEAK